MDTNSDPTQTQEFRLGYATAMQDALSDIRKRLATLATQPPQLSVVEDPEDGLPQP